MAPPAKAAARPLLTAKQQIEVAAANTTDAAEQLGVEIVRANLEALQPLPALGGNSGAISIHARDDKSGTYDTFKSLVLDPLNLKLLAAAHRYESSTELSDAVAADPGAIGFIGLPYVRRSKVLGISAGAGNPPIVPTQFTVGTEDYPLSRRLYHRPSYVRAPASAPPVLPKGATGVWGATRPSACRITTGERGARSGDSPACSLHA